MVEAKEFCRWVRGENVFPYATTFDKWEEEGLVEIVNNEYVPTEKGRQFVKESVL